MPAKKKTVSKKPTSTLKKSIFRAGKVVATPFINMVQWKKSLRPRTPHRSFRRTYRRDYERSLELPGYMAFSVEVWRTLWQWRSTFGMLIVTYALLSGALVGLASQSTYTQLSGLIRETGGDIFSGQMGKVGEAGVLLVTSLAGGVNPNVTEAQQLIGGILVLLVWLTTVWLLRAFLAGHSPRLRDGFYNSGAPIVSTFLLVMLLLVQLIPAALAMIGISAAMPTGLVSEGVEAMLFWVVVLLLFLLSLYWTTSTLLAMVVVTLPGMYPLRALKVAHELVVGRRLRIVLRVVWLMVSVVIAWALLLIPIIIFDAWLKGVWQAIEWVPIVPLALLVASSASAVWVASYIYLLYRKVVDDDSAPD